MSSVLRHARQSAVKLLFVEALNCLDGSLWLKVVFMIINS
jgi:hypothetical protein